MLTGGVGEMATNFDRLANEQWLNNRSRALLVEFFLYNTQVIRRWCFFCFVRKCFIFSKVNLFTVNTVLIEFPPIGGLLKFAWFQSVKLLRYERNGLLTKVAEGLFIMYLLVFLIKEGINFKKQKSSYFKQLWNWFEIILILLCLLAIVCYFLRQVATNIQIEVIKIFQIFHYEVLGYDERLQSVFEKFQKTQGNQYTNYSYAGVTDDSFTILMALILFVSTMKFCRLLRFNKNIALVTTVLKQCRTELFQFG